MVIYHFSVPIGKNAFWGFCPNRKRQKSEIAEEGSLGYWRWMIQMWLQSVHISFECSIDSNNDSFYHFRNGTIKKKLWRRNKIVIGGDKNAIIANNSVERLSKQWWPCHEWEKKSFQIIWQ